MRAEDRGRELIEEQLNLFVRAEENLRERRKRVMLESWTNLTGPLGHLRAWASGSNLISSGCSLKVLRSTESPPIWRASPLEMPSSVT